MTNKTTVRLAVVGAGVIGKRHIEAIQNEGSTELAAIVDTAADALTVAKQAGVACFKNVAAMCKTADVDAVVVSTPTIHHLGPAISALDAGCHVLVEKPITATMEQARILVEHSREAGLHVLVGHQRRYYGLVEKCRQLIADGELGTLVALTGQWTVRKADAYYEPPWRKERAAGPVLTNLIHEIDYLRYMCGEIESISAEVTSSIMQHEKEDAAAIVMRFRSGALGTFLLSDQAASPWAFELGTGENPAFPPTFQNCIRFMGTKASLDFPELTLWHHGNAPANWNSSLKARRINQPFEDAYALQCRHFARVIQGEQAPLIDAEDGARTLEATLAVFESAERGERIRLCPSP